MAQSRSFYRNKSTDKVLWLDNPEVKGEMWFTFDKKKLYNLFRDYPDKLSVKEWMIFNNENEYWEKFFEDRNDDYKMEHFGELHRLGLI